MVYDEENINLFNEEDWDEEENLEEDLEENLEEEDESFEE